MKIIFNPNISVYPHDDYVVLYNQVTEQSYKLGLLEFEILRRYESNIDVKDINDGHSEKIQALIENAKNEHILIEQHYHDKKPFSLILTMRVLKFNRTPELRRISGICHSMFYFFIPIFLLSVFAVMEHIDLYISIYYSISNLQKTILVALGILSILCSTTVHELSHMLIAIHEDADIPELGIKSIIITCWAYVKIIGISALPQKSRIKIYSAGFISNMIFSCMCLMLIVVLHNHKIISSFLFICGTVNILQAIINTLFVLKLDGHHILNELFDETEINKKTLRIFSTRNIRHVHFFDLCVYIIYSFANVLIIISAIILALSALNAF